MKRPKIEDYKGEDVSDYAAYNPKTGEYYETALEQYCDWLESLHIEMLENVDGIALYQVENDPDFLDLIERIKEALKQI